MTSLRITSAQRWWSIGVLGFCVLCSLKLAAIGDGHFGVHGGAGWYLVAAVLIAAAFLVLQLPETSPAPRAQPDRTALVWEVPVAFVGEAALIHDRLEGAGWTVGTSGPAAAEGEGVLTLEVPGREIGREGARAMAARAVKTAGALVERVGDARRIR